MFQVSGSRFQEFIQNPKGSAVIARTLSMSKGTWQSQGAKRLQQSRHVEIASQTIQLAMTGASLELQCVHMFKSPPLSS